MISLVFLFCIFIWDLIFTIFIPSSTFEFGLRSPFYLGKDRLLIWAFFLMYALTALHFIVGDVFPESNTLLQLPKSIPRICWHKVQPGNVKFMKIWYVLVKCCHIISRISILVTLTIHYNLTRFNFKQKLLQTGQQK